MGHPAHAAHPGDGPGADRRSGPGRRPGPAEPRGPGPRGPASSRLLGRDQQLGAAASPGRLAPGRRGRSARHGAGLVCPRRSRALPVAARTGAVHRRGLGNQGRLSGTGGSAHRPGSKRCAAGSGRTRPRGAERARRLAPGLRDLPTRLPRGQGDAHGDVVFWPVLALGEYLAVTGDVSLFADRISFVDDFGATAAEPLLEHNAQGTGQHRRQHGARQPPAGLRAWRLERLAAAGRPRPGRAPVLHMDGNPQGARPSHPGRVAADRDSPARGHQRRRRHPVRRTVRAHRRPDRRSHAGPAHRRRAARRLRAVLA